MIYFVTHTPLFEFGVFEEEEVRYMSPKKAVEAIYSYFAKKDFISFDSETTSLDQFLGDMITYQLGTPDVQFVVDESAISIVAFKDLLESKTLIIQNAKFDLKWLFKKRIVPVHIWDTMIVEKVLYTGIDEVRVGLDSITFRRLGIQLDKSVRKTFGQGDITMQQVVYGAKDVKHLEAIRYKQVSDLLMHGLDYVADLENKFVIALSYIEYSGMGFDADKWREKVEEDKKNLNQKRDDLNKAVIDLNNPKFKTDTLFGTECTVMWSSPDQVQKLFKSLGIEITVKDKKSGGDKESVASKMLESQRDKHPLVGMYLDYKKTEKLTSTFGDNYFKYIHPVTKRIHTQYRQILDTGRISCGRKGKARGDQSYPNLQQVPADKRHRSCFIPQKGNKMIIADYSSQESRVLVEFSRESNLVEFYLSGEADLHSYTAKLVYPELKHLSLEQIKKQHKSKRELMKKVNFALAYGGNAITISQNANIPIDQAEEVYNDYFKAFPQLAEYFEESKAQPLRDGFVYINSTSRRKSFIGFFKEYKELKKIVSERGFWDKYRANKEPLKDLVQRFFTLQGTIERKGLNYRIQGTSADMSKLAAWYAFSELKKRNLLFKVFIPNIVHDELHFECKEEIAGDMAKLLQQCMERAGSKFCELIPITAEVEIADWWSK